MTRRFLETLALACLLAGCASRSEREALRSCSFVPRGTARLEGADDSLRLAISLEIHNPGPSAAVLDSFSAQVSGGSPLAVLSHRGTQRILAGATDTVQIHLAAQRTSLLSSAALFAFAPPDSLIVTGVAWIPGWFGVGAHPVRVGIPYSAVSGRLKGLFGASLGPQ